MSSDSAFGEPAYAQTAPLEKAAPVTRCATRPFRGDNRVPYCDEMCPQHDGKRCRIMGVRPSSICEPEVLNLLADLASRPAPSKPLEEAVTRGKAAACAVLDHLDAIAELDEPASLAWNEVADALRVEVRTLAVKLAGAQDSLRSIYDAADVFLSAIDRERDCRVGCIHMNDVLRTGDILLRRIKRTRG